AIEVYLVSKLGDLGKKIHTARSRNDQVKVALALYSKDELNEIMKMVENSSKTEEASINTVPIKPKKHRYL
ncbi:MAG: hypothetical protein KKB19_15435, partial [Bacteroidetes bacterium]|nr:hypothetical protein [Bacteroidota bacterium]